MENTTTQDDQVYLVWYEEGRYTQRRFLVKSQKNAQEIVDKLNSEYGSKNPDDLLPDEDQEDYNTIEYWCYEPIDFKGE